MENSNFKPIGDRALILRIKAAERTASGLYIPEVNQEKPQEGMVIAVGDGRMLDDGHVVPMHVKPGNKVLFGKYSGSEIPLKGETYIIMREDDILGIVG